MNVYVIKPTLVCLSNCCFFLPASTIQIEEERKQIQAIAKPCNYLSQSTIHIEEDRKQTQAISESLQIGELNTDYVIPFMDPTSESSDQKLLEDYTDTQYEYDKHLLFRNMVRQGGVKKLRTILKDVNVNFQFKPHGETALWIAVASQGNTNVVRLLLENKAKVDLSNKLGQSPFWIASHNGHSDTAKVLLKYGADVNLKDRYGRTPLWAVANSQSHHQDKSTIMLLLAQENINVNITDVNGQSPLWIATKQGNIDACKCLMLYGADPDMKDKHGQSSVWAAAFYGQLAILKIFVNPYSSPVNFEAADDTGQSPLFAAASQGHTHVVELLLQHGANERYHDTNGYSPLLVAGRNDKIDTFTTLLKLEDNIHDTAVFDHCCNFGLDRLKMLHIAIEKEDIILLQKTLDAGADKDVKDRQGYTALHRAIQVGITHAMEIFLARGCDANIANKEGWTPLFTAIFGNSTVIIIEKLLRHGASVNYKDLNNVNPLQLALEKGQADVILLLLENGATAGISLAAEMGTIEVVQKLIETMIEDDINKKDDKGETALHKACAKNKLDIVQYLIENGALVNIVNVFGRAPLHTALLACSWDVAKYLLTRDDVTACIDYKECNDWNALYLTIREANLEISEILIRQFPKLCQQKDCFGNDINTFIFRGKIRYHKDETDGGDILPSIAPQKASHELANISASYDEVHHRKLKYYDAYDFISEIRNSFQESCDDHNAR